MLTSLHCLIFTDTSADLHVIPSSHVLCVFQETPWQKIHTLPQGHVSPDIIAFIYLSEKMWTWLRNNSTEMPCHWSKWTHIHTLGDWAYIWRVLWGRGEWFSWPCKWQYVVLFLRKSVGGHRDEQVSRPDTCMLPTPSIVCEGVLDLGGSPALEPDQWCCLWDEPRTWPVFATMHLFRAFPRCSLTCFRGEDQLFHAPPAMMLSQPIKILFHSQQGSWQPWVSLAGWTGCN